MQLQIKTLSNEKFTIECELTDTVQSVKQKIAGATHLKDKYEADAVKLIFSGKILEDARTLDSYSINQDSFLVVVKQNNTKPATSAAPSNTPSQPAAAPAAAAAAPAPRPAPTPVSQGSASGTTAPSASQPSAAASQSQDPFSSAEAREKALKDLTDMGFERSQAELALRASFYHVERAAEYLLSGTIPTMTAAGQGTSQTGGSGQTSAQTEGSTGGGTRRAPGADDLAELSNNPQFQALRQLIQQNPEQLQTLMQTLQQTQPELFQLIEQRPQEFLDLLNQASEGDEGDDDDPMQGGLEGGAGAGEQLPPGTVTITLSPQDQQAINRLQDMGFDRNRVIEAFLACDRNEELAANYLLSSYD